MKKIHEIIVVEGKNDTQRLKQYFDCDTIETGGDHVSREILDLIAQAQQRRGVIVFTDPDSSGERIRRIIKEHIPDAKHAFIPKSAARTEKKVGVEHAGKEDLENSLAHLVCFDQRRSSLSWNDFIDAGLIGDARKREEVCRKIHIGKCNAKTCFKRMNQMGITKEELSSLLSGS